VSTLEEQYQESMHKLRLSETRIRQFRRRTEFAERYFPDGSPEKLYRRDWL